MTYREPETMRQLHEIRERLYEERKDWSDEEFLEYYRRTTIEDAEKYGLDIAPLPHERRKIASG